MFPIRICSSCVIFDQVHLAVQQLGFKRVKRGLRAALPAIYDFKFTDNNNNNNNYNDEPTDPYFHLQWYLRNTGQNGGKIRLDLNVEEAWRQGITGKNITTAIMDDGKTFYIQLLFISFPTSHLFNFSFPNIFWTTFANMFQKPIQTILNIISLLTGVDYMHPDLKFNYVSIIINCLELLYSV